MTSLKYAKGTTTLLNLGYSYGVAGSNNGQIMGITDSVDNGRSVTYIYDTVSRLSTAVTTGSTNYPKWGLAMTYDRYGNRSAQSVSAGCVAPMTCPTSSVMLDATTNRITTSGYTYDLAGNMTNDGNNTLVYDAENRTASATNGGSAGTYTYDGNNLRVKKVSGSTTTVYIFAGSKVIAEYQNGAALGSPTREYIYSGSTLLAKVEAGATNYYHPDHLSPRLTTDASGNKVGEQGHFPFGESWYSANTTTKWQFTTYERDSESGNDYAMARYHVSRLGRFSSTDPLSGSIADPQSLDRYDYVVDDPDNLSDPSGLCPRWGPFAPDGKHVICTSAHGPSSRDILDWVLDYGSRYWVPSEEGDSGYLIRIGVLIPVYGPPTDFGAGNTSGNNSGGGPVTPVTPTKAQKCAAAQAKAANLKQQLHAQNPNQLLKTNMKELGYGAGTGCVVAAVTETVGSGGLGAPFAPGACAVGAVGGAMTAEAVFVLSNAGEIWDVGSTSMSLMIAQGQAALACHP